VQERSILQRLISRPEFGPLVLLIVELVIFTAINPAFLSPKHFGIRWCSR
jgi:simple sugar transport system permease protein